MSIKPAKTPEEAKALFVELGFPADHAAFMVRAVKNYVPLLDFARRHHDCCDDCGGTGKIYNNADPTSGQWVPCPVAEILNVLAVAS